MNSKTNKTVIKIVIGSEYIPEENPNYIKIEEGLKYNKPQQNDTKPITQQTKTQTYKPKQQNYRKIINKVNHESLYNNTPQLEFKSSHGEPYVYILDLVTNKISTPILAVPYYKCYNKECINKKESLTKKGSKVYCDHCGKELEINPHTFFNVNKFTYKRKVKPENTKDLDENGIPLAWELQKIENITGMTFDNKARIYDKSPMMVDCDPALYTKYHEIAKVSPKDLINKSNYKLIIYRNQAYPLLDHVGVSLESVTKGNSNLWKLTHFTDEDQYITAIAKIPGVDSDYADIEHLEEFKEILLTQYLDAFGEF